MARPAGVSRTTVGEDFRLINNRQGGRRRGRGGGGRPPGSNPSPGNRQDNRQRGNAAQLLEKYKGLARDAQMQGDRVQTETYLQYADHYFRVLGESRARFEEQRPQRGDDYSDEDEDQGSETVEAGGNERQDEDEPREMSSRRQEPRDEPRDDRNGEFRRGRGRSRRDESDGDQDNEERIALDVLPPAISAGGSDGDGGEAEPRAPRARRPRRPRDDEDVAPAA